MKSHGYVRLARVACFSIAAIIRIDYDLEIVFCLTCGIGNEHDVVALLPYMVGCLRLEDGDPERRVRLLERGNRDAGVLNMMIEAVVGKWFALPGLHQDLQCFIEAGALLPWPNVESLKFVLQVA